MGIQIEEYVASEAVNPYADDVKALAEAQTKTDATLMGVITVPLAEARKAKYKISKAAIALGFTASHKTKSERTDNGKGGTTETFTADKDGNVALKFTLGAKHKPRLRKKGSDAEVAESE